MYTERSGYMLAVRQTANLEILCTLQILHIQHESCKGSHFLISLPHSWSLSPFPCIREYTVYLFTSEV